MRQEHAQGALGIRGSLPAVRAFPALVVLLLSLWHGRLFAQSGPPIYPCASDSCLVDSLALTTGSDPISGVPYQPGTPDPFWVVVSEPGNGNARRAAEVVQAPANAWAPGQGNTQWIGRGNSGQDMVLGRTEYAMCFCVCGSEWELGRYDFDLGVLADDSAAVFVDETYLGSTSAGSAKNVSAIRGFAMLGRGIHCVRVVVSNQIPGHSGFDLKGLVRGAGLVNLGCCNSVMEGSGQCEVRGLRLVTDTTWKIISGPASPEVTYPKCAENILVDHWPPWGQPAGGTMWIGLNASGSSVGEIADYTYRKCFCMVRPGSLVMTLTAMSDDSGDVYLDGALLAPQMMGINYRVPTSYNLLVQLDSGCHCIDFVGHDLGGSITGINAEINLYGNGIGKPECCLCESCAMVGGVPRSGATHVVLAVAPNPAKGPATVRYVLEHAGTVALDLYDVAGKRLRALDAGEREAGSHTITINGAPLPAGRYYVMLTAGGKVSTLPFAVQ